MKTELEIKAEVKEKYGAIADQSKSHNSTSCCGATACCGNESEVLMAEDYHSLEGYNADADLSLGCGLPTQFAQIKMGDTVLDLGSGAGNDCFIARTLIGEKGKVIGIDFTEKMIHKSRENAEKLGFNNIEFRLGDIDNLPVTSNRADVVISNCVLNLVPNKHKVFSEIFRVLKPGRHFSISDIVLEGELPQHWRQVADLYVGCISGAIRKEDYLAIVEEAGFVNIIIQKEKEIILPEDLLPNYFSKEEIGEYQTGVNKIKSITVYAEKPAKDGRKCCEPGNSCC
jgi:ubiquinone/menaquinone biosynthesis C-methylase UbiE